MVPLLLCGALIGGVSYFFWPSDALEGNLTGTVKSSESIPIGRLGRDAVDVPDDVADFVLSDLQESPQLLKSPGLMDTEIRANPEGLEFRVFLDDKAQLVAVDYSKNQKLRKYVEQFVESMDRVRRDQLKDSSKAFYTSWKKERTDRPSALPPDLGTYRDSIVLTSMRGGFGHHVVAVVGKRVYQCVYEADAKLYFVIPAAVSSFELRAHPKLETKTPFPGLYQVNVKESKAEPADTESEEQTEDTESAA